MAELANLQQALATASDPGERLLELEPDERRDVFFHLPEAVQRRVVEDLEPQALHGFARSLDPDEAADLLGLADEAAREAVLDRLSEERREKVGFLLEFEPDTAAGLMDLDYVTVDAGRDWDHVSRRVARHRERTGRFPTIFVTEAGELLGELPAQALALGDRAQQSLRELVREVPSLRFDREDADVIARVREQPDTSVAVLDDDGSVLGVIHAEDLLRVVEEEATETLYEFTGVQEEENVLDGPLSKVRHRYKWLILNLGTAFLAAAAVGLFADTIAAFTLLAVYMPVVAGMGGNAGTQSMAVTVRGIAFGHISLATGSRAIVNEMLAGAANGAITGVLVAAIATLVNHNAMLGLVLGISMVANLVIAGFFGTLVPLVLDRVGKDPATSATIFITTATDVLGFFLFLGLARAAL